MLLLQHDHLRREFTSDHNVIRENTKDATKSGERYKDVEYVRATKYNVPMTQTVDRPSAESKMRVKVTWDWAGIPAQTPFKVIATSEEAGSRFESAQYVTNNVGQGAYVLELTAANTVGTQVRTIHKDVIWVMELNPGQPNKKTLTMGVSNHKIQRSQSLRRRSRTPMRTFHPGRY